LSRPTVKQFLNSKLFSSQARGIIFCIVPHFMCSDRLTGRHNLNSTDRKCFGSVTDSVTDRLSLTVPSTVTVPLLNMTSLSAPPPLRSFKAVVCLTHKLVSALSTLCTALNTKHTSEHQKYLSAASKHSRRQASFHASSLLVH